jgi:hypothetical protein
MTLTLRQHSRAERRTEILAGMLVGAVFWALIWWGLALLWWLFW